MELASDGMRRAERRATVTLPERLRSALTARGWVKRPEPRVRFGQPVLPGVSAIGPDERLAAAAFVASARHLVAGRITHLGHVVTGTSPIPVWFPRGTSVEWQRALHAHDELLALGIAGATASDPAERAEWYAVARTFVEDWLRRVPTGHPVAWSVPALGRRIRNWLLMQGLFAPALKADPAFRPVLLASLYEQLQGLAAAVVRETPGVWHVVAGQTLFLGGRFFDGMEARGWVEAGSSLIWGQLREQVLEDGGHASRSPVWQALVLFEYLQALAVLRADNDDVPMWGRKRVKGMADCLARLTHPDGTLPAFDPVAVDGLPDARTLLATAAVVLHEPGFALTDHLPGVWPLLVVGEAGRRAYAGLGRGTADGAPAPRAMRRTGFYVLSGGSGNAMVIDGGVRTCPDGPAVFGYELAVGGQALVVGAPVALEEPGVLAAHARSARSRNVLVGTTPASGASAQVETRLSARSGVQYFLGTCRGFPGLDAEGCYRRRVFCVPGRFWLVCDELLGTGTFSGASFVHLHPGVTLRAGCAGHPTIGMHRSPEAALTMAVAGARSLTLAGGMTDPEPLGWYPDGEGGWRAAPTVIVRASGTLPLVTGYLLAPRANGAALGVRVASDAFELRAQVQLADTCYELTAVQDEVELVLRSA